MFDESVLGFFRAGALLVGAFQLSYLGLSWTSYARHLPADFLTLSSLNLGVAAIALLLSFMPSFRQHWQAITLLICGIWTISAALMAQITGEFDFLTFKYVLLMTGIGALIPWERTWQAVYGTITLAAYLLVAGVPQVGDSHQAMRCLVLLTAAALAQISVALSSQRRKQMEAGVRKLREEATHRDVVIARLERARKQLEQSETKLRKIFEASPDTISILSMADGRYIDVSREFLVTGYTRKEVIATTTSALGIWANREQHRKFVNLLRSRGTVHNFEADFRLKDGSTHPCLISGTIIELDGEPCVLTIVTDVSRLKRTERELIAAREAALAASRAKSEFLSSMSHEIRTPMNAILGMTDLLAETELNEEQRKFVDTIASNGDSLLRLINDVLDLAKVESGRLTLEHTDFDLNTVAREVGEALGVRCHEKNLELVIHIAPDVPARLIGDPLRLRQVLINLVSNAIKFTERGAVILRVNKQPGAHGQVVLHFSVSDTGIGIPPDQLENIFSDFTQADASTSRKYGGTGLGLSIAKRLVEMMQGNIWAESEAGKGSVFHFTAGFGLQTGDQRAAPVASAADLHGVRTLVVDDTEANRVIVREILSAVGAEVGEADGGHNALVELERASRSGRPYILLILDCRMPGMDGIELLKIIRASDRSRELVVLMLTSDDLNSQLARAREAGVDAYLVKPIRREELLAAAVSALHKANRRRETAALSRRQAAPIPDTRPIRILLAEDSRDNRALIEAYLKKTPYVLDAAENGQIAVAKYKTGQYDVVLMDINMPVMDGFQALDSIREWERSQNRRPAPVIALTASAFVEDVRKAEEAGFQMHVAKPVKKSTLLDALSQVTGARNAPAKGPIVIEVDADIHDLAVVFLAQKRGESGKVLGALQRGDFDAVERFGHTLKGEGGSFGMAPASELGAELESAMKRKDASRASSLVREIGDYLGRVEIAPLRNPAPSNGGKQATSRPL